MHSSIRSLALKIFQGMFLLSTLQVSAEAQFMPGARALSLSQAMTARTDPHWAVFGNPAQLKSEGPSVSFYGGRYYGLPELTDLAAALSYGSGSHSAALGILRYGDDRLNDSRIRVGYSYSQGMISGGVAVQYRLMGFGGGYESLGLLTMDAGLSVLISEDLTLGSRMNPVWYRSVNGMDAEPEQELALGLSYRFIEKASLSLDLVKDLRYPLSLRSGVEYRPLRQVILRAGVSTEPESFSGGIGLELGFVQINMGVQRHWLLGISPGIDLGMRL